MSQENSRPTVGFDRFPLDARLQRGLTDLGFREPRPIQAHAIDEALAGRDVLGLAQTGTGKTAAFALPILQRLLQDPAGPGRRPRALVVAPTRELASQIQAEIAALAKYTKIRSVTIFGGVSAGAQIQGLRRNPDIVVACPGRLLDLHGQGCVDLGAVDMLVLDEADHMFDMGFLPAIRRILALLPAQRQNLLFSATMPPEIRTLADRLLSTPHVVELAHSRPAATIEHALFGVEQEHKLGLLHHIFCENDFTSAIVFARTKHRAKRLAQQLARDGHNAVALQGNMSQGQRERAMKGFRSGEFRVLVATDIAARGIDVAGVSHVVNFDVPDTPEAYTHRIGRTGRSECRGKAYTFAGRDDHATVRAIEHRLGHPIQRREKPAGLVAEARTAAREAVSAARPAPRAMPSETRGERVGAGNGRGGAPGRRSDEGAAGSSDRRRTARRGRGAAPLQAAPRNDTRAGDRTETRPGGTAPTRGAGNEGAGAGNGRRRRRRRG
jgi:ATP-dependent RNA helicase RhlE